MEKLKINLYAFGRDNFMDEVHHLEHELGRHGKVDNHFVVGTVVAQFTFYTTLTTSELKEELKRVGFTDANGLTVNLYEDDDLELEDRR